MEYFTIAYWIGYFICLIFLIIAGSYALANPEKTSYKPDILSILLTITILPFFSLLLILIVAIA